MTMPPRRRGGPCRTSARSSAPAESCARTSREARSGERSRCKSLTLRALTLLEARREALSPHGLENLPAVLRAVDLQDELDRRLAHVKLDPLADVLDLNHVGALFGDDPKQGREGSRPVGDDRPQNDAPPARGLPEPDALGDAGKLGRL